MPPDEPWGFPSSARRRTRRAQTWGRWNQSQPQQQQPLDESTVKVAACQIALDRGHHDDESRLHEMLSRFEGHDPADLAACEFDLAWAIKILEEDALGEARVRDVLRFHERKLSYG